jgi:hypothetical protein
VVAVVDSTTTAIVTMRMVAALAVLVAAETAPPSVIGPNPLCLTERLELLTLVVAAAELIPKRLLPEMVDLESSLSVT